MLCRRRLAGGCLLAVVISLCPTLERPAQAGGFSIPLIGGRGSTKFAFVARPDDTSAIYHNPAGLGLLGRYRVDVAGTGILSHTNYRRCTGTAYDAAGNPTGCTLDASGNEQFEPEITTVPHGGYPAGFGILPYLGLSGRFGLDDWNFGLAVYSPHNATGAFPDCQRDEKTGEPKNCAAAPQRFHAVLGTINTIYISPSVSWTPHPDVHLGVSVSAVRAAITSERSLWLGGTKSALSSAAGWEGEGWLVLDSTAWSAAFGLGVIWAVGNTVAPDNRWLRGLNVGVSYTSPSWFTFKDDLTINSPLLHGLLKENEACRRGDPTTQEVKCASSVDFTFPMQVRFAVHWKITEEWGVGFDASWQNYKVYDQILVKLNAPLELPLGGVQVTETGEQKNSTDCWTLDGGVQYEPLWAPGLAVRVGVLWDQSPYPDANYSLLSPDADKTGVVIGLGYRFGFGLSIDAAYIPLFYEDRIVRNSALRPAICPAGDQACEAIAPPADFSMNGDVRDKRVDTFLLQIGWSLDREP